jgi:hypothetical protein
VEALSFQSFALQVTIARSTHDKLRRAQALLGHQIPSGDLAQVLDRTLDLALAQLEKRKFAATTTPRRGQRPPATESRQVAAAVRREVWERDDERCAFVSEDGRRCPARTRLEFDHVKGFARHNDPTVAGIRLLCRAHHQYQAERMFGAEFMRHQRIAAAWARAERTGHVRAPAKASDEQPAHVQEVIPCLRLAPTLVPRRGK